MLSRPGLLKLWLPLLLTAVTRAPWPAPAGSATCRALIAVLPSRPPAAGGTVRATLHRPAAALPAVHPTRSSASSTRSRYSASSAYGLLPPW
ncbi:hypothetical protein Sgou_52770 [Streptomyces gougerotii]|uniref:Uncharacterized protein n=1 Tax=Streptomyces gougerotii TaxID=53448 RepID=A0ABQ1DDH5_9ACTN|nr:hypothetical protein Sgou_52770 [Streptomyces gougerotii]